MIRLIANGLTIAALLFLAGLAILAVPLFFDPAFEVLNESSETVFVVAEWGGEKKEIGNIHPMSSYEFSVNAEAAMIFRVSYPGGGEAKSEPIYFTSGLKVIATISSGEITVRYDHEI